MKAVVNVLKLIPAALGTVQALLPLTKELVVIVVRIIAIVPFAWSEAEPKIAKVNEVYNRVYNVFERIKDKLLYVLEK